MICTRIFFGRSKPLRYIFYAGGASPSPTYLQNSAVHNVGATIGRPFAQLNVEVFIRRGGVRRTFRSIRKNFQGRLNVEVRHKLRILRYKIASRLYLISHKDGEYLVRLFRILDIYL